MKIGTYDLEIDANDMVIWLKATYPVGTFVRSNKTHDLNDILK